MSISTMLCFDDASLSIDPKHTSADDLDRRDGDVVARCQLIASPECRVPRVLPQGSVLYIEHRATGDVKLKSNALDTLSIAGNTAIALGKATVADVGNYSFRLTVVDSGEPGSDDQFGLKVSKGANDVGDLTFAPITLSGGNIQVPKP